ncbi:MAG: phosphoribosylformylglycinamidine cyclo-ligase, partial [Deltaproteobacteria bacterium]|nr:phosphoribosylformylglycinamidine cyclo-ligase [Deltaproteobacteria bacterium]
MAEVKPPGLTYRDAGVDIDAGDALVERIKGHVRRTLRPEVMTDLGGFAGMCALPTGYREPLLVSCTDGVGTKLKLAFLMGKHDTVGIDLVAMNVNDLVVSGAEPLFFLDYFASGRLDVGVAEQVIAGIADGCQQAGCALLGGETAEMPGFYVPGEYDLAGFCVGVVERSGRVDGRAIAAGDTLLGLASSGFHSNGYSLVRRVFVDELHADLVQPIEGLEGPVGEALLRPTRIYVRSIRKLFAAGLMRGAAHITGGGLVDNPTRMLPAGAKLKLQLRLGSWPVPAVMQILARAGRVSPEEMRRTFNLGIGMIVCVPADATAEARRILEDAGEQVYEIGSVAAADA